MLHGLLGTDGGYHIGLMPGAPLASLLRERQRPVQPRLSLRDADPIRSNLHEQGQEGEQITFRPQRDEIEWKGTKEGVYTAKSAYTTIIGVGKIRAQNHDTWSLVIPPTVRIFLYLLLKEKILTQEVMKRRKMGNDSGCVMCGNCPCESLLHLILLCPVAMEVWYELSARLGYRVMVIQPSVVQIWTESNARCSKEWSSLFASACWHIWKRRNEKIFTGHAVTSKMLAERILIVDVRMWITFCNAGGRRLLGTNLILDLD